MIEHIHWLGHDGYCIDWQGKAIVIDPYQLPAGTTRHADLIFITHTHFDHLSLEDIARIARADTPIVAPASGVEQLAAYRQVTGVLPNQAGEAGGIRFRTVPAYNTNKKFHPRAENWVGYILEFGTTTVYHAGDTDHIPEMKGLRPTVALLPVSGTYVMTADEAAAAALDIVPGTAIPMHYDAIVGTSGDARRFQELLVGRIPVVIKPKELF